MTATSQPECQTLEGCSTEQKTVLASSRPRGWGVQVPFVLDSGAQVSLMRQEEFDLWEKDESAWTRINESRHLVISAAGTDIPFSQVAQITFFIGTRELNVPCFICPDIPKSILGMNAIRHYDLHLNETSTPNLAKGAGAGMQLALERFQFTNALSDIEPTQNCKMCAFVDSSWDTMKAHVIREHGHQILNTDCGPPSKDTNWGRDARPFTAWSLQWDVLADLRTMQDRDVACQYGFESSNNAQGNSHFQVVQGILVRDTSPAPRRGPVRRSIQQWRWLRARDAWESAPAGLAEDERQDLMSELVDATLDLRPQDREAVASMKAKTVAPEAVSYTHLTLPTKA